MQRSRGGVSHSPDMVFAAPVFHGLVEAEGGIGPQPVQKDRPVLGLGRASMGGRPLLQPADQVVVQAANVQPGRVARVVFGAADPILGRADRPLHRHVPGAQGQPHARLDGSHFVQEDQGAEIARRVLAWLGDPVGR